MPSLWCTWMAQTKSPRHLKKQAVRLPVWNRVKGNPEKVAIDDWLQTGAWRCWDLCGYCVACDPSVPIIWEFIFAHCVEGFC